MIPKEHDALWIVEEKGFRKFIKLVSQCPGYELPSRKLLSENLLSSIHNDVQAASALSLSTDSWTSRNNESYVAIVAHFMDENTKIQSALLGCINYNERDASQNLWDLIKDVIAEWHISH